MSTQIAIVHPVIYRGIVKAFNVQTFKSY